MAETSNRRRYTRYPIELDALLSPADGPAEPCTVHDFCEGGLLVRRAQGDASTLASGEVVRIQAKLAAADGVRPIAMAGKVVWARADYFGLVFDRPSPRLCQRLQQHGSGEGQRRPHGLDVGGTEARARARLRHVAKRLLPVLLRDLLLEANERMLEYADRVVSNTEQAQLFADMNALDALRKGDRLVHAVLDESEVEAAPSAQVTDDRELTLVDPDEFERWLEASRTSTMLERRFGGALSALGSRLAALRSDDGAPVLQTPFEPQHFTNAVKSIASDLTVGAPTRRILFDATGRVLAERLADFYAQLNGTLDALGAPAAQLRPMRVVKVGSSGTASGAADTSPATPPEMEVPAAGTAAEIVSGGMAGPALGDAVAAGYVPIDPGLLARAQAHSGEQRAGLAADLLRQVQNLPDMTESLQGWLGLLGDPLQQEALADPELFHEAQHPLREIIDALGHLQMFRPAPDGPAESDETRQLVNELLQPLAQGASDAATVQSIAQRLGELTTEQSRRYQHNVERVVEASDGRERVRLARAQVVAELNERYAAREVPEVLLDLLETGWRSVLELAALRDGEADETLALRLRSIDVLVARLGGQAYASKATDMPTEALLAEVATELASAAFDPFRVAAVDKRLRTELAGPASAAVRQVRFAPLALEDDPAGRLDVPVGISADVWPGILASCADVRVGDRLRFPQRAEQAPHELRVAWIRADGGLFTLVDYRGLRVRDIGRTELALGLYRREIQLERVDGKPLSERAVDTLLSRMEQRLAHQASHDSLTGLVNRNQFTAALEQALQRPDAGHSALLWIDIDQFRLVNDMHGFETGDRLLVAVARLLEQTCGGQVLAHVGADRFAVFYPDVSADQALQHAEHLREKVVSMPFSAAGQTLSASISVGLVAADPQHAAVGALLHAADDALSAAKGSGGNQVYRYDADDPEIQRHRESVRWVARVDEALEHGQLNLRCQPIVPVRPDAGLAPHYEVLLGVLSGSREALPIAEFIDAAERYNRMRAVDRWVTRTVIEWISAHRAMMPSVHGLAVNLSGQTASDPAFIDFVRQQFQRTGIDPSWLSFEVTETAAVADLSASAGIVQDLKRLGCRVALDDFGSGLASYSYLKELPVDWLKIDGAFVRRIATESSDFAVVKSINDIGHFLGKQTIAEYVADEEILRLVAEIGVDYAQGYAISKPTLLDDLLKPPPQATAGQRA